MDSKKNFIYRYFLIYIISLLWISFIVFWLSFFIKLQLLPEKYDYLTFWITIFNTLFGSWIIFSIYQWFIDRQIQISDDIIARFDFLLDNLLPDLENDILAIKWYTPFVLDNFQGLVVEEKSDQLYLHIEWKEETCIDYMKDNSDIYDFLYKNYQVLSYLDIKYEFYKSNTQLLSYIQERLMLYKNIHFYATLYLFWRIRGKNLRTSNSLSLEWKGKFLILNQNSNFKYISRMNDKILRVIKNFSL